MRKGAGHREGIAYLDISLPVEDIHKILDFTVSGGGEFAELFLESKLSHSVFCENSRVERISSGKDSGFGLRIMASGRTVYGYSNITRMDEISGLARKLLDMIGSGGGTSPEVLDATRVAASNPEIQVDSISAEEKVGLVLSADRAARDAGREIAQVQVSYLDSRQTVGIFNSNGDSVEDERRQLVFSVRAVASEGPILQTALRTVGGSAGFGVLDGMDPVELAADAGEGAIRTLKARPAPAGKMTVVLASLAGGTMVHEAIGHGLEGDAAEKNLSIYSGKVGEMVASPHITVIDDATLEGKRGSYLYDDEGVPARRSVLVENGILRGYLLDRRTAARLGTDSTGNGRRESFRYRPIVRMSNTMIAPGGHDPAQIINSVGKGLYVVRMGGGQVDTSSGDFVFKVDEAYIIEGGRVGEPVRGAVLIGNGPAVLKGIDMVGNDLGFDIGTCGKDGQNVPVADAQPTLRIPSITVGGHV